MNCENQEFGLIQIPSIPKF